jgi:hypothetical protein
VRVEGGEQLIRVQRFAEKHRNPEAAGFPFDCPSRSRADGDGRERMTYPPATSGTRDER